MAERPEELREQIAGTRAELGGTLDAIGDRVSPGRIMERRKNRMTGGIQSIRDRVMGSAHEAQGSASRASHAVADKVTGATSTTVQAIESAPDQIAKRTEGAPMVAGAIALGVGFLVAVAFPPTRREREAGAAILEKAEPVKEELKSVAQEVMDDLREPVSQAAGDLKNTASEAARNVAEEAKQGVDDVRETSTAG